MCADDHAKIAAATFATPDELRCNLQRHNDTVKDAARWIGHATWAATNANSAGCRDSEASRAAAIRCRRLNHPTQRSKPANKPQRSQAHRLSTLPTAQKAQHWSSKALYNADVHERKFVKHNLMRSGDVIWCNTCGSFGALRGRGLAQSCAGPVPKFTEGGRSQQLRRLRAGYHPKDRYRLPPAIPQHLWSTEDTRGLHTITRPSTTTRRGAEPARSRSPRPIMRLDGRASADSDAEELAATRFGRLRLRVRQKERDAARADARQGSPSPVRHFKRARTHTAHTSTTCPAHNSTTPHHGNSKSGDGDFNLTQELSAIMDAQGYSDTDSIDNNVGTHTTGCAPTGHNATDEEKADIRALRVRQVLSGGPIVEETDDDWHADGLDDYRAWVTAGRPDVILTEVPNPGIPRHPWVTYDLSGVSQRGSPRQQRAQSRILIAMTILQ